MAMNEAKSRFIETYKRKVSNAVDPNVEKKLSELSEFEPSSPEFARNFIDLLKTHPISIPVMNDTDRMEYLEQLSDKDFEALDENDIGDNGELPQEAVIKRIRACGALVNDKLSRQPINGEGTAGPYVKMNEFTGTWLAYANRLCIPDPEDRKKYQLRWIPKGDTLQLMIWDIEKSRNNKQFVSVPQEKVSSKVKSFNKNVFKAVTDIAFQDMNKMKHYRGTRFGKGMKSLFLGLKNDRHQDFPVHSVKTARIRKLNILTAAHISEHLGTKDIRSRIYALGLNKKLTVAKRFLAPLTKALLAIPSLLIFTPLLIKKMNKYDSFNKFLSGVVPGLDKVSLETLRSYQINRDNIASNDVFMNEILLRALEKNTQLRMHRGKLGINDRTEVSELPDVTISEKSSSVAFTNLAEDQFRKKHTVKPANGTRDHRKTDGDRNIPRKSNAVVDNKRHTVKPVNRTRDHRKTDGDRNIPRKSNAVVDNKRHTVKPANRTRDHRKTDGDRNIPRKSNAVVDNKRHTVKPVNRTRDHRNLNKISGKPNSVVSNIEFSGRGISRDDSLKAISRRGSSVNARYLFSWLVIFLVAFFSVYDRTHNYRSISNEKVSIVSTGAGYATYLRNSNGHFMIPVNVKDRQIYFLLDTGASDITLRRRDADIFGIDLSTVDFSSSYQTANGFVKVAPVTIPVMTIGPFTIKNVKAVINDADMDYSLLGMSVLKFFNLKISGNEITFNFNDYKKL